MQLQKERLQKVKQGEKLAKAQSSGRKNNESELKQKEDKVKSE